VSTRCSSVRSRTGGTPRETPRSAGLAPGAAGGWEIIPAPRACRVAGASCSVVAPGRILGAPGRDMKLSAVVSFSTRSNGLPVRLAPGICCMRLLACGNRCACGSECPSRLHESAASSTGDVHDRGVGQNGRCSGSLHLCWCPRLRVKFGTPSRGMKGCRVLDSWDLWRRSPMHQLRARHQSHGRSHVGAGCIRVLSAISAHWSPAAFSAAGHPRARWRRRSLMA